MSLPKDVTRLIEKFDQHLGSYRSGKYNEAQLRNEFLNPFFKALGWDLDNDQGLAEAYKDVVHEDSIRIGAAVKAPDYCFRIGGTRKFFLEAKKPSVDIGQETSAAYQLRRYAWSAKLPLSILSDFEEFAVYDCRVKPNKSDSAATARVFLCRFQDYPEKWEWISSIFSKEAILKGSFDKYAEENKAKRGTSEVDDDFLATIERWRSELAKNIALRNSRLSQRELNFAVQCIIDRIIFLRICEDRGSELYGRLQGLTNGPNIYQRLCEVFEDADGKYNSGLFHFKAEKGRHEPPDELTLGLDLDDKLLRDLLRGLYYPESPYEFTVISSDILGQAYEQFLGKVIRLTEGHHAVVEDKPEVKKAGGVYYTPAYIVDYIVRQTVGKLVEGKTPKQVSRLRILDPACGSGSFLINAYQFLLDWHHDWYLTHKPETWVKGRNPVLVQTTAGWKLTIAERKRILLDNIYGVDIDAQAVEVTKLSLLLKVLEGESEQTIQPYLRLFSQRALPDLGNNIKCGNSLIGPEFYSQKELPLLSDDEKLRINVFDWEAEFPEIMKSGGFDAIIGNPPWGASLSIVEKEFHSSKYQSFCGNYESYLFFIEKAIELLKEKGQVSFVTPDSWIRTPQSIELRRIVLEKTGILSITTLPQKVFNKVSANCIIFILAKNRKQEFCTVKIMYPKRLLADLSKTNFDEKYVVKIASWKKSSDLQFQIYQREEIANIINRIINNSEKASAYLDVMQGIVPYSIENHTKEMIDNRVFHSNEKITKEYGRWVQGRAVSRYHLATSGSEYLRYGPWLHRPRKARYFEGPRILIQEITGGHPPRIAAGYYDDILYHDPGIISCLNKSSLNIMLILGIMNSKLISWYHRYSSPKGTRHSFPKVLIGDIRNLPFPEMKVRKPGDLACHDRITNLVEQLIDCNKRLSLSQTPHEKEYLQRQIISTDMQVDKMICQLYGLTDDDIRVIETT